MSLLALASLAPGQPATPGLLKATVSPASPPTPSLKYQLLPPRDRRTAGNAATLYYRAMSFFAENRNLLEDFNGEHWDKWLLMALSDLPTNEVGNGLSRYRLFFQELALAGRCRECDWHVAGRAEGIGLLLPEVQVFRRVGNLLAVKARYHLARREWDDATASLQSGFALAVHLGRGPTFIHVLVGLAIGRTCQVRLEEFVQQPEAPNLYWALATLPRPFADLHRALDEERALLGLSWPWLSKVHQGPMTPGQVKMALEDLERMLASFHLRTETEARKALRLAALEKLHAEAKKELPGRGVAADALDAMPPEQAVALYLYHDYLGSFDEAAKWLLIPDGARQPGYEKAQRRAQEIVSKLDLIFFRGLLTGLGSAGTTNLTLISQNVGHLDRRLAALMVVEALRAHAAAHDGKWPDKVDELSELPAPPDPVLGRPFEYSAEDGKAVISAALPPGGRPIDSVRIELALRKKD